MESETAYLAVRILNCGIFFGAGLYKLFHFDNFSRRLACFGFPLPRVCALLVVGLELVGSALLVINVTVWAVALVWIGFTIWASWLEHRHVIELDGTIVFSEWIQLWKNVSIVGGLLAIALLDPTRPEWVF